ncbi:MAG: hypothetical protein KF752_09325 [Pirellulaceae bacterium]|nr:hypothetical protein [Pirellulaceae bacterium]
MEDERAEVRCLTIAFAPARYSSTTLYGYGVKAAQVPINACKTTIACWPGRLTDQQPSNQAIAAANDL